MEQNGEGENLYVDKRGYQYTQMVLVTISYIFINCNRLKELPIYNEFFFCSFKMYFTNFRSQKLKAMDIGDVQNVGRLIPVQPLLPRMGTISKKASGATTMRLNQ